MPHIPPLGDEQAPQAAQPLLEGLQQKLGMVPNFYRTLAHKPDVLDAVLKLNSAIQDDLPDKLREMAYVKTSKVNGCDY